MEAVGRFDVGRMVGILAESDTAYLESDRITGLGLRSRLLADLADAVAPGSSPSLLAIFALEGFREYEELNGVLEARKLLRSLATRLARALDGLGSCYRPRGDEFAALIDQPASVASVLEISVAALTEHDRYCPVAAVAGYSLVPSEASDPIEALALADRRLSANAPRRMPRR